MKRKITRRGGAVDKVRFGLKLAVGAAALYRAGQIGYGLYKLHQKLKHK
jgi:hypothetical protein